MKKFYLGYYTQIYSTDWHFQEISPPNNGLISKSSNSILKALLHLVSFKSAKKFKFDKIYPSNFMNFTQLWWKKRKIHLHNKKEKVCVYTMSCDVKLAFMDCKFFFLKFQSGKNWIQKYVIYIARCCI